LKKASIIKTAIAILTLFAVAPIPVGTATAGTDLKIGVFLPERTRQAITDHQAQVGRQQDIVMFYQAWGALGSYDGSLDVERIQWIIANGSVPMITWEPWAWGGDPKKQPEYRLSRIIAGNHDDYIREFARAVKQVNGVIYLRPMHEMNGDWYPWAGTVNGNSPSEYVPAFRHIVNIFRQEGADNVRWVWTPNNVGLPDWGTSSFKSYYPGDNYVDFAGIDGYNFGTSQPWSSWTSFEGLFDQAYKTITGFTQKPIIIAETASAERGGSKADWVREAYAKIGSSYPRIVAVIWFNEGKETDWPVDSSDESLAAYKQALGEPAPPAEQNPSPTAPPASPPSEDGNVQAPPPITNVSAPNYSTSQSKMPRLRVSWSSTSPSPSAGIASYQVQRKVGRKGRWSDWLASVTANSAVLNGSPGKTYYFRARATDTDGNRGPWSTVKRTIVPHDNDALMVKRSGFGRVANKASSKYYLGTVRYATKSGASVTYRFSGRSVALIGTRSPKRGKAKIYLDGKHVATVDGYAKKASYRRVLFTKTWKTSGKHNLTIVNEGTPGRRRFDVDAIGVAR
jgi:mannan endo-1,4-beta-mannosidase